MESERYHWLSEEEMEEVDRQATERAAIKILPRFRALIRELAAKELQRQAESPSKN